MFFNKKKKLELQIAEAKAKEAEALLEAKKAEASKVEAESLVKLNEAQLEKAVQDKELILAEASIKELSLRESEVELEKIKAETNKEYAKLAFIQRLEESTPVKQVNREVTAPYIPDGVIPKGKENAIAMDSACSANAYNIAQHNVQFFPMFEGFPKLSFMMQSSDYYSVIETTANEMTREWGEFKIVDGDDEASQKDKAKELNQFFEELGVKDLFNKHIRNELIFGRSQIFIDVGAKDETLPLIASSSTIQKGTLKSLSVIEPIWSTPSDYNSTRPTEPDFFEPDKWYVLGKEIHADRLLTMINRPVPDMFKPAYNFSGLSMLQLMQPYVERWQRGVDAVADLLVAFSISGFKTDMGNILSGNETNPSNIIARAEAFNRFRDNRNLMLLDKDTEEFFQFNTPLSGVPELLKHLQEQMSAPSKTPLVKLIGITPSGLNASSEGEIRVYYDYISSLQESNLLWQIKKIGDIAQLHLFGAIDPSIQFIFKPLHQLNEKEVSEKISYDTMSMQNLVNIGAITNEEARTAIAKQEEWILGFIDPGDVPEMPEMELDYGEEDQNFERDQAERRDIGLV